MVEWMEKNNIAGWLDGQEKQKDDWMDIKKVWIERKMVGWIKIDGWLNGYTLKKNRWLNGYKRQRDGTMYNKKQMDGWKEG